MLAIALDAGCPLSKPVCMANMVAFGKWLDSIGVSHTTGWRWKTSGWISTVNISGRLYVTAESIEDFERRAKAGEFSIEHKTPEKES